MSTGFGSTEDESRIQSGAFETFDPVEMSGIVPQARIEHTLLDTGEFKGSWLRAQLGRYRLGTAAFNRRLLATGQMPLSFGVLLDAAGTSRVNGNELHPGDSVVFGEDSDVYLQLAPRAHWCFLQIQREDLESLGARVEPSAVEVLCLSPELRHGLGRAARGTIEMLGRIQAGLSDVSARPALIEGLQNSLLSAFVRSLDSSQRTSTASRRSAAACAERYALVRDAESLIMAPVEEPLSITQICAHLGTTVRRLELAFDYLHGMSPKQFQTMRRLSAFRHDLLCPSPDRSSVTEIALACGFAHLGRLSSTYKDTFEELPSETLSRTQADMTSARIVRKGPASPQAWVA